MTMRITSRKGSVIKGHKDASLREAFTTPPEAGSLLHGRRLGGLKGKQLQIHTFLSCFRLNPPSSSAWEELSPRATEEGIAERRILVRLNGSCIFYW